MARKRRRYPVDIALRAELDLLALRDYIARDKPRAAEKWLRTMHRRINVLRLLPLIGEIAPESPGFGLEIRHLIQGNYRIFYLFLNERVNVVRVIHAARQITPAIFGLEPGEQSNG